MFIGLNCTNKITYGFAKMKYELDVVRDTQKMGTTRLEDVYAYEGVSLLRHTFKSVRHLRAL